MLESLFSNVLMSTTNFKKYVHNQLCMYFFIVYVTKLNWNKLDCVGL